MIVLTCIYMLCSCPIIEITQKINNKILYYTTYWFGIVTQINSDKFIICTLLVASSGYSVLNQNIIVQCNSLVFINLPAFGILRLFFSSAWWTRTHTQRERERERKRERERVCVYTWWLIHFLWPLL